MPQLRNEFHKPSRRSLNDGVAPCARSGSPDVLFGWVAPVGPAPLRGSGSPDGLFGWVAPVGPAPLRGSGSPDAPGTTLKTLRFSGCKPGFPP